MRSGIASIEPIVEPIVGQKQPNEPNEPKAIEACEPPLDCELAEFLSGDLQPDRADPEFRRALEDELWEMVCAARGIESSRR